MRTKVLPWLVAVLSAGALMCGGGQAAWAVDILKCSPERADIGPASLEVDLKIKQDRVSYDQNSRIDGGTFAFTTDADAYIYGGKLTFNSLAEPNAIIDTCP